MRSRFTVAVLLSALLTFPGWASAAASAVSFGTPTSYTTVGTSPLGLAVADLNDDEKLDVLTANFGGESASILLGNGDGTFANATTKAVGNGPSSVAAGDINGDGKVDMVTANNDADQVGILLGNGNGTFANATSKPAGGDQPRSIALSDLDDDGNLDVATANIGSSTVSVLLGNGDGTFANATTFATGNGPGSISVGDLNGDGDPDLVATSLHTGSVSVLLGHGDGTFGSQTKFNVDRNPRDVTIGDLNADGTLDIATSNSSLNDSESVSVLIGTGNGTFSAAVNYPVDGEPTSIAVGDLDGDVDLDVVTGKLYNISSTLLGNGDGTFSPATDHGIADTAPWDIALADFNQDGKPDVASVGSRIPAPFQPAVPSAYIALNTTEWVFGPGPSASVSGDAQVGSTLTAGTGSPSPTPDSYSYQWYADGIAMVGERSSTFTPTAAEIGKKIKVTVTAIKTGYTSASHTSTETQAVTGTFSPGPSASVSGDAQVGSTLTAGTGSPSPTPDSFTYQWFADGSAIDGATSETFTPTSSEAGKKIKVTVTATKTGYTAASNTSTETGAVTGTFSSAPSASVSGDAQVGSTLTAGTGSPSPTPDSFTYQWFADGSAIDGATSSTFTPTSGQIGKKIKVTVTAIRTSYTDASDTSPETLAVAGKPAAPSGVSAIRGNGAAAVSWTAPADNGSAITGYTVTSSPEGKTCVADGDETSCTVTGLSNGTAYTFTVTARNDVGTSEASPPSQAVTPLAPLTKTQTRAGWHTKPTRTTAGTVVVKVYPSPSVPKATGNVKLTMWQAAKPKQGV